MKELRCILWMMRENEDECVFVRMWGVFVRMWGVFVRMWGVFVPCDRCAM
jgi:hypothetical protein